MLGRRELSAFSLVALMMSSLLLNSACTSSVANGPSGNDELGRANYLIDKKQYSEAIYVLESRLKRSAKDNRARVLLASAYAARAGVQIANYTAFAHEIDKWKAIDELLPPSDDDQWIQAVSKMTFRLQIAVRAFQALPSVSGVDAQSDIRSAVKTLDEGGRLDGGPSLFRALLRVVDFKQRLYEEERPRIFGRCQIRTDDLANWLSNVTTDVSKIIEDVGYGLKESDSRARTLQLADNLSQALKQILQYQSGGDNIGLPPQVDVPPFLRQLYGQATAGWGSGCR